MKYRQKRYICVPIISKHTLYIGIPLYSENIQLVSCSSHTHKFMLAIVTMYSGYLKTTTHTKPYTHNWYLLHCDSVLIFPFSLLSRFQNNIHVYVHIHYSHTCICHKTFIYMVSAYSWSTVHLWIHNNQSSLSHTDVDSNWIFLNVWHD